MKLRKRLLATFLALCLVLGILPGTAWAAELSGKCGEDVFWIYDESTGTLTILGSGDMFNYTISPWDYYHKPYSSIKDVVILDGVTSIGNCAFLSCNLTSVSIPTTVTQIGYAAFTDCPKLKNVDIPESVTAIDNNTFQKCTNLKTVSIPDSVSFIGRYAFDGCSQLTSISIPDGISTIEDYAFRKCSKLTTINLPESVICIGRSAFYLCSSITEITIPANVTSIGEYAFTTCYNLQNVNLPKSVTEIGKLAFYQCTKLKNIYYSGTESQWNKIAIEANNEPLTSATIHYIDAILVAPIITINPSTTVTEGNTVSAFWSAISGATKYHFDLWDDVTDRIQIATGELFNQVGTEIKYDITEGNLAPGRYRFEVYAEDANGNKGETGSVVFTVVQEEKPPVANKPGDLDGDGRITITDVIRLARGAANYVTLTEQEQKMGDVDGDGKITMMDVVRVARYAAGYISEL